MTDQEYKRARAEIQQKLAAYDARRKSTPPRSGATPPKRDVASIPKAGDWVEPARRMDMRLDPATAAHEAAHALVAGALMIPATAIVNDDGSGQCRYSVQPGNAAERALLAVAGTVGERLVFGGDLQRAVRDALTTESDGDGAHLREAMADVPAWRQREFVFRAAKRAWAILADRHNRPQFDELRARLAQGYRVETMPE